MLLGAVDNGAHRNRKDHVLLFDATIARPILLHRFAVLAEMIGPGSLEIATLVGPEAVVIETHNTYDLGAFDRLLPVADQIGTGAAVVLRNFEKKELISACGDDAAGGQYDGGPPHTVGRRSVVTRRSFTLGYIVVAIFRVFDVKGRRVMADGKRSGIEILVGPREFVVHPIRVGHVAVEDADV